MRVAPSFYRSTAAIALAATALLLVSACGSAARSTSGAGSSSTSRQSANAAASTTVDSCTVISEDEAGAALGQTVKPPVRGHATVEGGVACVFYGPNVPAGTNPDVPVGDSVRIVLVSGPKALRYFNDYRDKVQAQAIAGLGDKAYYDGYASLSVLNGDEYLRVAVIGVTDVLGAEETLAHAAVPRM